MTNELEDKALYGLIGDIVRSILVHSEAHAAAILYQLFAMFVNVVGRSPFWSVEGKKHFLQLFVMVVGPTSSGRKGSSLGYLKRIFERVDQTWFKECLSDGLSSGEGLIYRLRDPEGSDPGVIDKRLLPIEEEFASVLKVAQREGNILSAIIRKCWDGESLNIMTKNAPIKATDPHVCMIAHITQAELERYIDATEIANGFGNRFLPICVSRSKILPFGGCLSDEAVEEMASYVSEVVKFSRSVGQLRLSKGAEDLWLSKYEDLTSRPPNLFGAMTARGAPQVRRLACIYALFDHVDTVTADHLEAALSAWRYSEESCRYLFGESTGNPIADKILKALQAQPTIDRSQLLRNILQRNTNKEDLDKALRFLSDSGLIFRISERPEVWSRQRTVEQGALPSMDQQEVGHEHG